MLYICRLVGCRHLAEYLNGSSQIGLKTLDTWSGLGIVLELDEGAVQVGWTTLDR